VIQLGVFRRREGHITASAAQRVRRHIKDGHGSFEVFRSIDFPEHGRLSGPRCKAISRQVGELDGQVRAQAGADLDACGIPDAILAAPIGLSDAGAAES
jgi:hypothetical protein